MGHDHLQVHVLEPFKTDKSTYRDVLICCTSRCCLLDCLRLKIPHPSLASRQLDSNHIPHGTIRAPSCSKACRELFLLQDHPTRPWQSTGAPDLKEKLDNFRCSECAATPELPRNPKLSIPPEATPNFVVSLDAMPHHIWNKATDILVIIDLGDMLIHLKLLSDRSTRSALNALYARWISIFNAPTFVVVDRGSNLAAKLSFDKLHEVEWQLCPVSTEAPWGIGLN